AGSRESPAAGAKAAARRGVSAMRAGLPATRRRRKRGMAAKASSREGIGKRLRTGRGGRHHSDEQPTRRAPAASEAIKPRAAPPGPAEPCPRERVDRAIRASRPEPRSPLRSPTEPPRTPSPRHQLDREAWSRTARERRRHLRKPRRSTELRTRFHGSRSSNPASLRRIRPPLGRGTASKWRRNRPTRLSRHPPTRDESTRESAPSRS